MQKIQSYLYPNRIILIADLAGFTVENTIVYAKTVKIYKGVDNVIEFDIQNADQKRLDLVINPLISNVQMNIMDASGNALPNSPYSVVPVGLYPTTITGITVTTGTATATFVAQSTAPYTVGQAITISNCSPSSINGSYIVTGCTTTQVQFAYANAYTASKLGSVSTTLKGVSRAVVPEDDLYDIETQYLKYSVIATDIDGNNIPLYTDSRFGAVGTIEVVGSAMPTMRKSVVYDRFSGEINFMGNVTNHTSSIPCKFYEAVPTTTMNFQVVVSVGFIGQIYVETTEDSTISVESWTNSPRTIIFDNTQSGATTVITTINSPAIPVGKNNYMRISWLFPDVWQYGSQQNPNLEFGMVDSVTVCHY